MGVGPAVLAPASKSAANSRSRSEPKVISPAPSLPRATTAQPPPGTGP